MPQQQFLLKKYLLIFTLAILSCANKSGTTDSVSNETQQEDNPAGTYITCTIDGKAWKGNAEVLGFPMSNEIVLGGENDEWAVGLNIPSTATAGQTVAAEANVAKKVKDSGNLACNNGNTAVAITGKTTAAIEGRFSFTATNPNGKGTVKIENGTFKAKLVQR
jgi:Family of unknown function (DUF6252)